MRGLKKDRRTGSMHGGAAAEFAPAGLEASWTNALQLAGILPAASKQHKCTVQGCGYASARAGDLARHTRIHTGEKPHKCTVQGCGSVAISSSISSEWRV